ncbi:MAG: hypothetical protein NTX64_03360 [Elusimicrobia bacterium]|nr:hypothetical protein [Elusimicrobiota bacterium]
MGGRLLHVDAAIEAGDDGEDFGERVRRRLQVQLGRAEVEGRLVARVAEHSVERHAHRRVERGDRCLGRRALDGRETLLERLDALLGALRRLGRGHLLPAYSRREA